ncbi:hypothetical protein JZU54_01995, partial [bacterium]|nr:hypothetical protein [bacterium]
MILLNHSDSAMIDKYCTRFGYAVGFAFPLLVAAGYAGELFPRRWGIFQAAALLGVWAHWQYLDPERDGMTLLLVWIAAASIASTVPGL